MPHLEITEVVLVRCNIASNNFQQDTSVVHTFIPNKSFGQLLDISQKIVFSKTFNSELSFIEVWVTYQNSKPRQIEDKITITLVIN